MFVYRLNRAHHFKGTDYPTGGSSGELFQKLVSAMNAVPGREWKKRDRRKQWETEAMDIITKERVKP